MGAIALPAPPTSFVARASEVDDVAELVRERRLVTLLGPGGVGKTRLAIEVAQALDTTFSHGVWFIDLSGASTELDVVTAVADSVGAAIATTDALVTRLCHDHALLVLDNCEQIVSSLSSVVASVVAGCSNVRLLATSREPIGVRGEQRWLVTPLAVPNPDDVGRSAEQSPAARLFVARARLSDPAFEVVADNLESVGRICRALDGLPLAIELAAAWIGVLTPRQIADGLAASLDLLHRGPRDAPERHRSMRAALQWSYDMLSSDERTVFDVLWVFSGGFTPESVAAVCGIDSAQAFRVLAALADRSMVTPVATMTNRPRFATLRTIASYALERSDTSSTPRVVSVSAREWVLRSTGDHWQVGDATTPSTLKDSKGLGYLHTLIARPGLEMHVLDLVGAGFLAPNASEELIDDATVRSYRARLEALRDEIKEARDANDDERAAALRIEFDAIADELQGSVGLGGRLRRAPDVVERARMSVRKAVKTAMDRITKVQPDIGAHLAKSLHTGVFCSYDPEPGATPEWDL